jgi:hypothetical protein
MDLSELEDLHFAVARRLGWTHLYYSFTGQLQGAPPGGKMVRRVPPYCVQMDAALELWKVLLSLEFNVSLKSRWWHGKTWYSTTIGKGNKALAEGASLSPAWAICSAFVQLPISYLSAPAKAPA